MPLNKLKMSPRNVRKTPHSAAAIEALAASISAKRLLQKPVVEPERKADGGLTGTWLVTIGEGRRLALKLLARRGQISKSHLVPCLIDTEFDPQEISLDENITRSAMHPADQFEAFLDLHLRLGWGAEDIGARFGVSAQLVRQRLRLACISPLLLAAYREEDLTLEQLTAFAVSEDHARQEQVYSSLSYNRSPSFIRQALTAEKAPADDRRAIFIGLEAYEAAGGAVLRDLFCEDRGGWLEDVALLDQLACEKLSAQAEAARQAEGWTWCEAHLDYPSGHGLSRIYPRQIARTPQALEAMALLGDEREALIAPWSQAQDLPPEAAERVAQIDAELAAFGEDYAYDEADIARGGLMAVLTWDGGVRFERGLIRPEDARQTHGQGEEDGETSETASGEAGDQVRADALPERLVAELTAYRTASLRDALGQDPQSALVCLLHALVLATFYASGGASCLDISCSSRALGAEAPAIEEAPAGRRVAERHEGWARQTPPSHHEAWDFVLGLDGDSRMALLAHCVGLCVDAVEDRRSQPAAIGHAQALAHRLALDLRGDWRPDARSYLGRVTKARILEAVAEAAGEAEALRLAGLKKSEMVEAAEALLSESDWLPSLLRAAPVASTDDDLAACRAA
nr:MULTISPECIES: ParB/Srx family N-terminal domain-containing protein [unclassified Phenylobacterium]